MRCLGPLHMSEGSLVESSHPSPRRPPPPGARPGAVCAGTYQRRCRRRCHSRAAGIAASTTRVRSPSHHGGRRVVRDGVPHPIPTPPWAESPPKAQIKHEDGSAGKESDCRAEDTGDTGLIPVSGRSSGEGNGNPLQYFCLENSMDRGTWQGLQSMGGSQRVGHD